MLSKKDIIHITAEVVVVIGISYYFSLQNKILNEQVKQLSSKLEEQEKIINSNTQSIKQLLARTNGVSKQRANVKDFKNVKNEKFKDNTVFTTTPQIILTSYTSNENQPNSANSKVEEVNDIVIDTSTELVEHGNGYNEANYVDDVDEDKVEVVEVEEVQEEPINLDDELAEELKDLQ